MHGYSYAAHYGPHDFEVQDWSSETAKRRVSRSPRTSRSYSPDEGRRGKPDAIERDAERSVLLSTFTVCLSRWIRDAAPSCPSRHAHRPTGL
jgi:hypothetical protein